MRDTDTLRQAVCDTCARCHERGWLAATDGNITVRLDGDRLLATPSGLHKGFLQPHHLIVTDMAGRKLTGEHAATSEMAMHVACYAERPDVNAVVHMHPVHCIALSLAGIPLDAEALPEIALTVGMVPTVPFSEPATDAMAAAIRPYLTSTDAMILERHGTLCIGADLLDAYGKLERIEHAAHVLCLARQITKS